MKAGAPTKHATFPEWLTRKDDEPRSWTVQEGTPTRGDAWTNFSKHEMKVPMGDDEISRVVRAHEMVHAKVSPKMVTADYATSQGVDLQQLTVAEEFRVNMLAKEAGFDMDLLRDGSEVLSGEIAGKNMDWNSAVRGVTTGAGTKAANDFIRGVKKHNPEMAASLTQVHNELKKMWRKDIKSGRASVASTQLDYEGAMPRGFHKYTRKYAQYIASIMQNEDDNDDTKDPSDIIPNKEDVKRSSKTGQFARVIEKKLPKPNKVDGRIGRKRTATDIGRNPRRISRLLTDPEKRIFDKRTRGKGGVVLIDQSGSMDLNDRDIWNIIEHAPGCVIIGYSHSAGSHETPNVWVIADRGAVADGVPKGNGGNGVDGPAIRFAAKRLRTGEPFIWVCDGVVTDAKHDQMYANLTIECAKLVKQHSIHMVYDVDDAVQALKRASRGERLPTKAVGPVERVMPNAD